MTNHALLTIASDMWNEFEKYEQNALEICKMKKFGDNESQDG